MEESKYTSLPLIGDRFPEMKVKTTHGEKNLPADYQGKWFVLFSHPGDFTPVCTTEFHAFAVRDLQFKALNTELIGLSIDQVFSHIEWVNWIEKNLKVKVLFPVIADDRGVVAERLGMLHPGKGSNTVRAVFIVDPKSVLRLMLYYPQEIGRNLDEILRVIKAMQTADANGVAVPANWPGNELIGDKVIVPPASNVTDAAKRLSTFEGYDWWFCYRDLKA